MSFNQTYQFFTDPDGDPLTLTFANVPAGLTFTDNGGGVGSIVGTAAGSSPWTVDVTADDGQGGVITQQFTLVCEPAVNPMPPSCPPNQSIDCADMPVTIAGFSGATSITSSGNTTYTVTPSAGFTTVVINSVIAGEGDNETITITASNADGSCDTIVTVSECVTQPPQQTTFSGNWVCEPLVGATELCESFFLPPINTGCGTISGIVFSYNPNSQSIISISETGGGTYSTISIGAVTLPLSNNSNSGMSSSQATQIKNAITANANITVVCN